MAFDHELFLIRLTNEENAIGDPVQVPTKRAVLCDWESITRSEHYQAAAHGLKPEIVFKLNRYEYEGEREVEFQGKRYKVDRTYLTRKSDSMADFETIELVCSGLVGKQKGVM